MKVPVQIDLYLEYTERLGKAREACLRLSREVGVERAEQLLRQIQRKLWRNTIKDNLRQEAVRYFENAQN